MDFLSWFNNPLFFFAVLTAMTTVGWFTIVNLGVLGSVSALLGVIPGAMLLLAALDFTTTLSWTVNGFNVLDGQQHNWERLVGWLLWTGLARLAVMNWRRLLERLEMRARANELTRIFRDQQSQHDNLTGPWSSNEVSFKDDFDNELH